MKRKLFAGALIALCCGCSSMNNTEAGALGGGAIGGLLGAGIGSMARAPGVGALIGAGTGAAIGAMAGNSADREERHAEVQQAQAYAAAQQAQARAPRLDEIVQMAKNGVPDANIITQIREAGVAYSLTSDDLVYLSRNGVSSVVIMELQNHRPRPAYTTAPVVYTRPVYVCDPYYCPPPPFSVGIGFGHMHHRHRHW